MMIAFEPQVFIFSIGWALIHFLWQGTLITFAYYLITRSIKSVHAKYWTGMGLVLLSLIIPFVSISTGSGHGKADESMVVLSQVIISHQQLNFQGLLLYFINLSLPFIVLTWAIVVSCLSFRLIRSWLKLADIKHECDPSVSNQLRQYVKNIAIKLDLPNIPFLKISNQVKVPAAYGLLKPTILLPLSLISQIPKSQLEAILKHELCHLKRHDFAHNIIQLFADIMFFFHPGIKWMNNDIRHIREQCCDQMVLAQDTEPLTYAKALTNIAAFTNGMQLKPSVQIGINDGILLNRVKFLLQNKSSQSSLMIFLPFVLIIIAMIILQLGQSYKDQMKLNQTGINQQFLESNESSLNSHKRLMGNQSFYPHLNLKNSNKVESNHYENIHVPSVDPNLLTAIQSELALENVTKNQLQSELNRDMQINNYQSNILSGEVKAYEPLTEQARVNKINQLSPNATTNKSSALIQAINAEPTTTKSASNIMPAFERYSTPRYPQGIWYNKVEFDVNIKTTFKIQPDGRVYDIKLSSNNNSLLGFEKSVERAMKKWRFDVNTLNDSDLQRTYEQTFSFNMTDDIIRKCESTPTGTRISRSIPCNK